MQLMTTLIIIYAIMFDKTNEINQCGTLFLFGHFEDTITTTMSFDTN